MTFILHSISADKVSCLPANITEDAGAKHCVFCLVVDGPAGIHAQDCVSCLLVETTEGTDLGDCVATCDNILIHRHRHHLTSFLDSAWLFNAALPIAAMSIYVLKHFQGPWIFNTGFKHFQGFFKHAMNPGKIKARKVDWVNVVGH